MRKRLRSVIENYYIGENRMKFSKIAVAISITIMSMQSIADEINDIENTQESKELSDQQKKEINDPLGMETIVVTGTTSRGLRKLDVSYAVTTLDVDELRARAPRSLAQSIEAIPGMWVEATGGVASNNVRARGIPLDGFRSVAIYEDGLPVQHDMSFGRGGDQRFRLDETIERVEAVRGGTSSIFASNAPGGLINYVTRRAGDEAEGILKYTWGDYGHHRADFWYGAPLTDEWSLSTGGFYRSDDGIRSPGYKANVGGQVRFNLTHTTDDHTLDIGYKVLQDRNIFYVEIPLSRDSNGDTAGLTGVDPNYGTMQSLDNSILVYPNAGGGHTTGDLRDGYPVNLQQFTVKFDKDFDSGWTLSNKFRWTTSTNDENSLFVLSPEKADDYLNGHRASALADSYFVANGVTDVGYRYTNHPDAEFDVNNQNGNGLINQGIHVFLNSERTEFINDFSLNRQFSFADQEHNVTFGFYYADVDFYQDLTVHGTLFDVRDQPDLLDVVALDADGNIATDANGDQLSVTQHGSWGYGLASLYGGAETHTTALYVADEWQVNDDLRIDGGFRVEQLEKIASAPRVSNIDLGDPTTLADNNYNAIAQGLNGGSNTYSSTQTETAWSLGANYGLTENSAIYGRYVSTFRFSANNTFEGLRLSNASEDDAVEATVKMKLYEVGYKLNMDNLAIFATLFRSDFEDQAASQSNFGGAEIVSGIGNLISQGVELETFWTPTDFFDLKVTATYMPAETSNFSDVKNDDGDVVFEAARFNGKRPVRVPEKMLTVTTGFNFGDTRAQLEYRYLGQRYQDLANIASTPSYFVLNGNISTEVTDNLLLSLQVSNITNEIGLTSGNPRSGEVVSSDDPTANVFNARPLLGRAIRLSVNYEF